MLTTFNESQWINLRWIYYSVLLACIGFAWRRIGGKGHRRRARNGRFIHRTSFPAFWRIYNVRMPKIWDAGRQEELLRRLEKLGPDTRGQWGQFTPARMLAHCASAMEAGLGDLPVKPKKTPFNFFPMNKLVIYWLPWPKSAPTAPELLLQNEPNFVEAKAKFQKSLDRFVTAGPGHPHAPHAAFGKISANDWASLTYRHIDHHWRQFGL